MGNNGFNAFENSLVFGTQPPNIASELIGQDEDIRKLFLSLSFFMDVNEATDFAWCIHKCRKHHLKQQEQLFLYMINARVSVKGYRSAQIVDVLTQLQIDSRGRDFEKADGKQHKGIKTPNA